MYRRALVYFVSFLLLSALACNLPGGSEEPANEVIQQSDIGADQTEQQQTDQGETEASSPEESTGEDVKMEEGEDEPEQEVQEPTDAGQESTDLSSEKAMLPVGIREGLASLNSYQVIMRTINNGPTQQDRQESEIVISYSSDEDSRHMQTDSLSSSAEYPEISQSIEDQYQIGSNSCTISTSDGSVDVTAEEITPLARDMVESTSNLFDLVITIPDPTFIGSESVDGIEADHYTFRVTGLGDYSGEEVTHADGEYWIAQDGNYLVKYDLLLEVRSGPEGDQNAEVMHSEYSFELQQVNQPISIEMPGECISAQTDQS